MTHLTFCTKDIPVTVNYLGDYLGLEESKEINTKITDMRCFWGATVYDDTEFMNIDLKHNRTTFYILFTIPLEELNDSEVAMLMRKHTCTIDQDALMGALLVDSDHYEVEFDITYEDAMLTPAGIEIFVDQAYMHII